MEAFNSFLGALTNFYHYIVSSVTLDSVVKFVVIYFFALWIAFIIWIIKDITNRTTNLAFQVFCLLIIIVLTPIFGLPIYLLIRPRMTIFEKYYEETEFEEDEEAEEEEEEVFAGETYLCHKCSKKVSEDFKFCPHCESKLFKDCQECRKPMRIGWKICAFCGNHQDQGKPNKDGMKVEVEKVNNKPKRVRKFDISERKSPE